MTATSPMIDGRTARFRELDGLRGIAAFAVVVYHYTSSHGSLFPEDPAALFSFGWGEYGVQLFFLVSGFVILMTAWRARRPSDFVISRVSRLYPPYWLSLVFVVAVMAVFPIRGFPTDWDIVLVNLTMIQRWLMVPNVVDVYWTLGVEMQFYVVILLLLLVTRCRLSIRVILSAAVLWAAVSWAVVLVAFTHTTSNPQLDPTWVKLLNNATIAEYGPLFIMGMVMFLIRTGHLNAWWTVPVTVSTVANGALMRGWEHGALTAAVCVVFVIVVLRERTRFLLWKPVQWYGKISYSLYIMHSVPGYLIIHFAWPYLGRDLATVLAIVVASVLSWLCWKLGEQVLGRKAKRGLESTRSRIDRARGREVAA